MVSIMLLNAVVSELVSVSTLTLANLANWADPAVSNLSCPGRISACCSNCLHVAMHAGYICFCWELLSEGLV